MRAGAARWRASWSEASEPCACATARVRGTWWPSSGSIGPCCYTVGEEVRHAFESQFAYARELFSDVHDSGPVREKYPLLFLTARAPGHSNIGPQIHLDLWEANRRQLLDAGVPVGCITVIGECTACAGLATASGRKYFSHRAENGFTGRMMAVIGVAND